MDNHYILPISNNEALNGRDFENHIEFEHIHCALCGSSDWDVLIISQDKNYRVQGTFQAVQCRNCSLIYQNPRPTIETVGLCYPQNYGPHQKAINVNELHDSAFFRWKEHIKEIVADLYFFNNNQSSNIWERIEFFPFYIHSRFFRLVVLPNPERESCVLDIGCGNGNFLAEMKRKGWQVWGVEPDAKASSLANDLLDNRVKTSIFTTGLFPPNSFDLITMWHVLEHIPDPTSAFFEVTRLLKPGGIFVSMVPNIASLEFLVFKENWLLLDLPRHLFHFTPKTIHGFSTKLGLQLVKIDFHIERRTLEASIRNFLNLEVRQPNGLAWRLLGNFLWLISFILAHLHTSGTMTVYCRKKGG